MKISVIIPTKERHQILQRTINHLLEALEGVDAEILIVNDSKLPLALDSKSDRLRIVDNPKSGAASARNTGVHASNGELLLFLDDDILVNKANILKTFSLHKDSVKKAFNFFWIYPPELIEALPKTSFGRYVLNKLLFTNSYRLKIGDKAEELIKTDGLTSQYFSILKSDFLLAGGYNENIPHAGIEDLILYGEFKKSGIEVYTSPGDIVFQNESDRLNLRSILERARRGAITMRIARSMGYEMHTNFAASKRVVYSWFVYLKPLIYRVAVNIPNLKLFDYIYMKFVNLLLGLSFYQGYFKNKGI
jgi:glycosyltransferase involved in cell wall biosynthesis